MRHAASFFLAQSCAHNVVKWTNIAQELPTNFFRVQAESYTKTQAFIKFHILLHKEAYRTNIKNIPSTTVW
jgi:hypothetical protein